MMTRQGRSRTKQVVDRVAIGGLTVTLRSDLDDVRREFNALYRCYPQDPPCSDNTLRMELRRRSDSLPGRARYRVIGDGRELFSCVRRAEALPYLEWGINRGVIARPSRFLLLHAAGAVLRDQAMLLAAPSGSGKSTISIALLADGWRLLGEEIDMIDPATLHAHPFPKALCIKSHGCKPLERIGVPAPACKHFVKALGTRVGHVAIPVDQVAYRACAVSRIVLPIWTGSKRPELRPVSRVHAALALTAQILNRADFGLGCVKVISRLVAGAECYELRSGEIDQTVRVLRELAGSSPDANKPDRPPWRDDSTVQ